MFKAGVDKIWLVALCKHVAPCAPQVQNKVELIGISGYLLFIQTTWSESAISTTYFGRHCALYSFKNDEASLNPLFSANSFEKKTTSPLSSKASMFSRSGFSNSTEMVKRSRQFSFVALLCIQSICCTVLSIFLPSKCTHVKCCLVSDMAFSTFCW
jgi:hypothetical protein